MRKQILNTTVFSVYKNKSFLAIVPARGGSKRLPRKNLLDLNGKPLIAWSIESGLKSEYIDKVIVSSDDDEILSVSKKYKSDTIVRPSELASDTATTFDAIKHAIDNTEKYDYVVLLQPTSPLRSDKHIDSAIELLFEKKADSVVSVCEMEHSPLWANTLPNNKSMDSFIRDAIREKRSQDLDKYYRLNGAIYLCKVDRLLKEKSMFVRDNIYAYVMGKDVSVDIDERIDFDWAEFLMSREECK